MKTAQSMMTRPMRLDTDIDYAERSGAAFLPTLESHVAVPFVEALISGIFAGIPVGLFIAFILVMGHLDWGNSALIGLVGLILTTYVVAWWSWHGHLRDYKSLLWYTEFAEGPEQQVENKQVHEARVKVNNHWRYCDLPFDRDNPQALVSFAQGVSSGVTPFSERGAGRHGYSVQRFNELRDNLIRGGLAYWKDAGNKKLGLGLTRGGIALLRNIANNPPADDYEPDGDDWAMSPETIQK